MNAAIKIVNVFAWAVAVVGWEPNVANPDVLVPATLVVWFAAVLGAYLTNEVWP